MSSKLTRLPRWGRLLVGLILFLVLVVFPFFLVVWPEFGWLSAERHTRAVGDLVGLADRLGRRRGSAWHPGHIPEIYRLPWCMETAEGVHRYLATAETNSEPWTLLGLAIYEFGQEGSAARWNYRCFAVDAYYGRQFLLDSREPDAVWIRALDMCVLEDALRRSSPSPSNDGTWRQERVTRGYCEPQEYREQGTSDIDNADHTSP
ncbi:MAG: hypothetical protein ACYTKD_23210 [Planctomycetota bacterium]|jgi:hypothetical protein